MKKEKPTGYLIGYARVSTEDQDLRMQIALLEEAGCHNIWKEKRSATSGPRPVLEKALIDLRPGDTLVVWKLDRLVRHARDLYKVLDRLEDIGATVKSLTEPHLDITTPVGEFMMGMTALLARLEARTTGLRTKTGMDVLRATGWSPGAPQKLSPERGARLVKEFKAGATKVRLAEKYGLSPAGVGLYLKRAKKRRTR